MELKTATAKLINGDAKRKYGTTRNTTAIIYAIPVKIADFTAPSSFPSDLFERYSDEDMDKAPAIPVIIPAKATSLLFCRAKVKPAKVPRISTSASFNPSTIDPIYFKCSSSIKPISSFSCLAPTQG